MQTEEEFLVKHICVAVDSSFEEFTAALENALGRFDSSVLDMAEKDPAGTSLKIEKMEGKEGLMLFSINDHGLSLKLRNQNKKAKQYHIGNPIIAGDMTSLDLRAALYAPLRVLIYEADDRKTYVEYDLPSTLFGQFNNDTVTATGLSLDDKLKNLIGSVI